MNYQDLYHVGVRVPDLDAAMAELGPGLGVTWAEARDSPAQEVWTPADGFQKLHLRYVYSAEGPQHIELLQGPAGSIWDGNDIGGAHHVGIWVDDVVAETDALIAQGWTLAAANRDPSDGGGYGVFTYVQPPSGLIVELVDRVVLPFFEQWWAEALPDS